MSEQEKPLQTSLEWQDYVMGQFAEDELIDGCPTVNGLRRVTHLLIGPIISQHVHLAQVPTIDNLNRATALVTIEISVPLPPDNKITFTDGADADALNTNAGFEKFPTAIAITRAEARTLRKALKLKKAAAEEMVDTDRQNVSQFQISTINMLCGRLNVDVNKFIVKGKRRLTNIQDATFEEASKMIQMLSEYQKDTTIIPKDIRS